jgi:hypothetical protein
MLPRVVLVRTDVSEELSASIIRVTRIGELGTMLAVTSKLTALTRATRRNIPEDAILHSLISGPCKVKTFLLAMQTGFGTHLVSYPYTFMA